MTNDTSLNWKETWNQWNTKMTIGDHHQRRERLDQWLHDPQTTRCWSLASSTAVEYDDQLIAGCILLWCMFFLDIKEQTQTSSDQNHTQDTQQMKSLQHISTYAHIYIYIIYVYTFQTESVYAYISIYDIQIFIHVHLHPLPFRPPLS